MNENHQYCLSPCWIAIVTCKLNTSRIDKTNESVTKAVMLEGYVSAGCVTEERNGEEFEITTFQGDHHDEYVVKNVDTGDCCLFRKGVLELRWSEENGQKVGGFTMYEKGRVLMRETWQSLLNHDEHRYVENVNNHIRMVIQRGNENHVVYRGEYDESMKRDGEGYAYDEESGRMLIHGVWKNDELFQILQEFESENKMIEYEVTEGKENVGVLNRRPVYIGGYAFNKSKECYVRHGKGNEIDVKSGIAKRECEWANGEVKKRVELFDGWYEKGQDSPLLWNLRDEEVKTEIHNEMEWSSMDASVTDIIVSSNCCNEESLKKLDLGEMQYLRRIVIGDDCFKSVDKVKIIGLQGLTKVVIGDNCFSLNDDDDSSGRFYVKNCPALEKLQIGKYSFSDYTTCKIENVDSLKIIEIGELSDWSENFDRASLELKSVVAPSES